MEFSHDGGQQYGQRAGYMMQQNSSWHVEGQSFPAGQGGDELAIGGGGAPQNLWLAGSEQG